MTDETYNGWELSVGKDYVTATIATRRISWPCKEIGKGFTVPKRLIDILNGTISMKAAANHAIEHWKAIDA